MPFSSLPHLSLFHGTSADFLFSSLFAVEGPLVWIIERLLFTFLVNLLVLFTRSLQFEVREASLLLQVFIQGLVTR